MRPKDPNQLAKQIVDIGTRQIPDPVRLLSPRRETRPKPRRSQEAFADGGECRTRRVTVE